MAPSRLRIALAAVLAGCLVWLAGCSVGVSEESDGPSKSPATQPASTTASTTAAVPRGKPVCKGSPVTKVVQRVEPSVVTVRTPNGLGSGIVYRPDIVLTDQHVVAVQEGAGQVFEHVRISLADGSTLTGKVIGSDLTTDLAVIRVGRHDLPPLTFRTTLPRQGETVLAIGSPLGFSSSVTKGIVSALGRDLPGSGNSLPLVDLIQTDAPISPGNSGGALIDLCGHVVGVNEAYISPQSGAVALGFATPAVIAAHVADQLIAHGVATHPYLGIRSTSLTADIARALGTSVQEGVVVVDVVEDGPADKAGIRPGDVITELAGTKVTDNADLLGKLRTIKPGTTVDVRLNRAGKQQTVRLTVGSRTER